MSVLVLNDTKVQLRFLCPSDVPKVKQLCTDWFPIELVGCFWIFYNLLIFDFYFTLAILITGTMRLLQIQNFSLWLLFIIYTLLAWSSLRLSLKPNATAKIRAFYLPDFQKRLVLLIFWHSVLWKIIVGAFKFQNYYIYFFVFNRNFCRNGIATLLLDNLINHLLKWVQRNKNFVFIVICS